MNCNDRLKGHEEVHGNCVGQISTNDHDNVAIDIPS